jgi:uncharacterized protein YndB with AHSA1/START domain
MLQESKMSTAKAEVSRLIDAPVNAVFRAWTDPKQMVQWMGPDNVTCERVELDVRPGGAYVIEMKAPQGEHTATGVYKEVIPNKKLVFTWEWKDGTVKNSQITVTFAGQGTGTLVTILHEMLPTQDSADQHAKGWTGCLNGLSEYCNK